MFIFDSELDLAIASISLMQPRPEEKVVARKVPNVCVWSKPRPSSFS